MNVMVYGAGGRVAGWKSDMFDISVSGSGNRYVKKWQIDVLVNAYLELKPIYEANIRKKK